MALDTDEIDDAVLALLFLTLHDHWRAWKGVDWDALDRLYQKGLIGDPVNKAKSVVFTEEGLTRAEELFRAMFTKPGSPNRIDPVQKASQGSRMKVCDPMLGLISKRPWLSDPAKPAERRDLRGASRPSIGIHRLDA